MKQPESAESDIEFSFFFNIHTTFIQYSSAQIWQCRVADNIHIHLHDTGRPMGKKQKTNLTSAQNDHSGINLGRIISALLHVAQKDFIPIKQLIKQLMPEFRKNGTGIAATPADLKKMIFPRHDNSLQMKTGYVAGKRVDYVTKKMPDLDLVRNQLEKKPGLTVKQLAGNLPLSKKEYIPALNQLMEEGSLIAEFTQSDTVRLSLKTNLPPTKSENKSENEIAFFKSAYDNAGKGKSFVRIHRIRENLNWDYKRFDDMIKKLRSDYIIELHGGDNSMFTEKELSDSYVDENGLRFLTLSWRGGHAT